jgi:hypothetical protein
VDPYLTNIIKPYVKIALWRNSQTNCELNPFGVAFVAQNNCVYLSSGGVSIAYGCGNGNMTFVTYAGKYCLI